VNGCTIKDKYGVVSPIDIFHVQNLDKPSDEEAKDIWVHITVENSKVRVTIRIDGSNYRCVIPHLPSCNGGRSSRQEVSFFLRSQLINPALVDVDKSLVCVQCLKYFLRIHRSQNFASQWVKVIRLVLYHTITHLYIQTHYSPCKVLSNPNALDAGDHLVDVVNGLVRCCKHLYLGTHQVLPRTLRTFVG